MQIVPFTAEIAPRLERLFQENQPVPTRLWAILDGTIQGRILVDEPTHPMFAVIQDLTEGSIYSFTSRRSRPARRRPIRLSYAENQRRARTEDRRVRLLREDVW
jgi:hypothetical protein